MELKDYEGYVNLELTEKVKEQNIPNSKWLPFIGKEYNNAPEKVLVVGLSHYDDGQNPRWSKILATAFPHLVMFRDAIDASWKSRFVEGLETYFFGVRKTDLANIDEKLLKKLWHSVAFTQFSENVRLDGKQHKGEDGAEMQRLVELIKIIKPDHVLFASIKSQYRNNLEKLLCIGNNVKRAWNERDKRIIASGFKVDDHNFTFYSSHHPSYFKFCMEHHSLLKETMPEFIKYLQG